MRVSTESYKITSVTVEDREQLLTLCSDKRIKGYQIILVRSKQERQLFSRSWLLTLGSPCHGPYEFFNFSFEEIQKVPGHSHRWKIHKGLLNINKLLPILSPNWLGARRLFQKVLWCFHPALVLSTGHCPTLDTRLDGLLRGAISLCLHLCS